MISIPTVLILGAGASAHCGYPLGRQLMSELCSLEGSAKLDALPNGWTSDDAETMLTRLSRSAYGSIDEFLERNTEYASLGKFLIALQLKRREDVGRLFLPNDSGWYEYLFNNLLVDGRPEFGQNSLGIVTFNYDRSLEAYLHTVLQNRFGLDETDAAKVLAELPVVHVHGILGHYPQTPYSAECEADDLADISRQIQIVHEIRDQEDGFCNEAFREAHDMLTSAQRIFFLGFGFHPDNVRRFCFFTRETAYERMWRSTAQLAPLQIDQLVSSLAEQGFDRGTFPSTVGCNDFFGYVARLE